MERNWFRRVLRYGSGLLIALLIFWGFYGFVKDDNWLAVSALATLVLALGAFWTIWDNRCFQRRERRERLLNEIIEWAEDVSKCGGEGNYEIWRNFTARYFDKLYQSNIKVKLEDFLREKCVIQNTELGELILSFATMRGKSHYITKIASIFSQNLQNAIMKLIEDLEVHIELLSKCMKDRVKNLESIKEGNDNYVEDIGNHKQQLDLSAQKVIEEATKTKTRDMGNKEENMSKEGKPVRSNEITLKDIEKHLTRIEGFVIQIRKNMKAQGVGGFGFTGMAAGMALVATGVQTTGGLVIFSVGLIVTLYSFYFM